MLEPAVLKVAAVAKLLGLGRDAAYGAIQRGEIPSLRFGRRIVVPRAALQRLLNGESLPEPQSSPPPSPVRPVAGRLSAFPAKKKA